jgi:hypothetical protein
MSSGGGSFASWFDEQRAKAAAETSTTRVIDPGGTWGKNSGWWPTTASSNEGGEDGDDVESQSLIPGAGILRRASTAVGLTSAPEPPPPGCCQSLELSRGDRIKAFTVLILVSALFFALAFFVGLPMVVLAPAKFALSFTIGSLSFMAAFAVLEGPWSHCKRTCSRERAPFTLTYIASMALTLWSSLVWNHYLAVATFSTVQVCALLFYGATHFPGGTAAMKYLFSMVSRAAQATCLPLCRAAGCPV